MVKDEHRLSRRDFLRLSALTAVGATIAACGPQSSTQPGAAASTAPAASAAGEAAASAAAEAPPAGSTAPIAAPAKFAEAPMLASMVEAGKLPPVAERLPKSPYVPPHAWLTTGKYGGAMNWVNSWGSQGVSTIVVESMYGHSPLRWLRDGLEIGPGLAESWETNDDTTEWILHFREGLKWSDGEPWTVNDIMFWWDDMVNVEEANEAPPDEARSGTGTLAKFEAVDDYTLKLIFDAPAPLTADRIAMWVNNSTVGPRWHAPRHYMEQFHPKYNTDVKDFVDFTQKIDGRINPDYPVMSGWKLKEYKEGTASTWERNPFYWAVDKEGNQLPYIDTIRVTGYQDKEVEKVNYLAGKADFTHHWVLTLADVAAAMQAKEAGGFDVRFWDSGDGTGQAFFFNWDYKDPKMRELIRNKSFRRALSHAFNRPQVQKDFYFNRGEQTSGTYSPKAIEYNINDEGKKVYAEYRDFAVKYDPEQAKQLLDEAGVKAGADGKRTMPDGSPLLITLDYGANQGRQIIAQNERLAADFQALGLETRLNPMPPEAAKEAWKAGDKLTNADWGIGDGPNHLVYPQWLVPIEEERWAPLTGTFYKLRGTDKVSAELKEIAQPDVDAYERNPPRAAPAEGDPIARLWEVYDKSKVEPDAMARHKLVWDMIRIHIDDGPFIQGSISNAPYPLLIKNGLMNVPKQEDLALGGFCAPWIHPTPAVYDPETWFWDNPDQHA